MLRETDLSLSLSLVSLNCCNNVASSAFMTSTHSTRESGERKIRCSTWILVYTARVPLYRGICESDVVCIKRIKIQASARNVRIHCGLYLSACFSTREYKNRSLCLCFITRGSGTRIETIKRAVHLRCTRSWAEQGICWREPSARIIPVSGEGQV